MSPASLLSCIYGLISPLLPHEGSPRSRGRPRVSNRAALEGILLVLSSGIAWKDLPESIGCSASTCFRRFKEWTALGLWPDLHSMALLACHRQGKVRWDAACVDSSHVRAKRGGEDTGPSPVDRSKAGTKHHIITDAQGLPLVAKITAGNVHDSRMLLPPLVDAIPFLRGANGRPKHRPGRLYGDKGHDSKALRKALRERGIVPRLARRGIDSGGLGKVRWVVERTFAWLHEFKRLGLRFERIAAHHAAFLVLACSIICIKSLGDPCLDF